MILKKKDLALDELVLVGHSMGGLIGKLMTINGGDDFWNVASNKSLDELQLKTDTREQLTQVFYFNAVQDVKRVIFMGTPHRGSKLSPTFLGKIGKKLVRLPEQMTATVQEIMEKNPQALKQAANESFTSIDLLDPESPALQVLYQRKRPEKVHFHSVVGVIKKNHFFQEFRDVLNWDDAPGDGVVRYDSAHLKDAESELVVQADHMKVHHHPKAVQEVRRILYQHLNSIKDNNPIQQVEYKTPSK